MKINIPIIILAFLAISSLNQPCEGFSDLIGTASSLTGLAQFVGELVDQMKDKSSSNSRTLQILEDMNKVVRFQLTNISKILTDLPSINDHVEKRNKLQRFIDKMAIKFILAYEMKIKIDADMREDQKKYETFKDKEFEIKEYMIEIQNMLIDGRTASYLTKNFTEGLRLYENVCITNMSHQELLRSLIIQFKVAIGQYFTIRNMMYDFVLPYRNDSKIFNNSRKNLRDEVFEMYTTVVQEFKKLMASASQEIWKCDLPKTVLDTNKQETVNTEEYYELNAFSKYVFNEGVYATRGSTCPYTKCPAITKVDNCGHNDVKYLCRTTRKCPNNLVGCNNLHAERKLKSRICVNSNTTAIKRYTSLVSDDNVDNFYCLNGKTENVLMDMAFLPPYGTPEYCNYCQCICPEKTYYISTQRTLADISSNKVVTGARLLVEDDTIYVQIQQATLLHDGIINTTSAEWLDIEKNNNHRVPISWEGIKSIDLTSFKFAKNSALVGLGFQMSDSIQNRITLMPYACKFNIRNARIGPCFDIIKKNSPTNELKLNDVDSPTKALDNNRPISNDDQFVTFTITSMEKDGGQTTVPFIDTQKVTHNPPTLLSGAGLYLRGQPGYGGFLALKLYTYNLAEHMSEYFELPGDIRWKS